MIIQEIEFTWDGTPLNEYSMIREIRRQKPD
jgi:hypothetical protein